LDSTIHTGVITGYYTQIAANYPDFNPIGMLDCILSSYDIIGSMISQYLHFLWLLVKTTHDDAYIFKTGTLNSFSSATEFNFENNECIHGKKTIL
jgi:hypothetical protein